MRHFSKLIGLAGLGVVLGIAPASAGGQFGGRSMGHFVAHPHAHFFHPHAHFARPMGHHAGFHAPGRMAFHPGVHGMGYHHYGYHHYGYRHPGWRHYGYYRRGFRPYRRGYYGYGGIDGSVGLYYSAPTPAEDAYAALNGYPTDAFGYPLYYYTGYPIGYDGGEFTPTGNGVVYNIAPNPVLNVPGPKIIYLHPRARAKSARRHMQIIRHGVVSDAD